MEIVIVKNNYSTEDKYLLVGEEGYENFGINLNTLFYDQKAFLVLITDNALGYSYDYLDDNVNILFNPEMNRYIKKVFEKEKVILERAKECDKEETFKEILRLTKEKYKILLEDANGN